MAEPPGGKRRFESESAVVGPAARAAVSFGRSGGADMPTLGPIELILILVIFLIFFGAGKLGDVGGALAKGVRLFKENAGIDSPKKNDDKPAA